MILFTDIIGLIFLILLIGRFTLIIKFRLVVRKLLATTSPLTDKFFSYTQLEGLPEPVRIYFKKIMKEGQPYIKMIRMTHGGQFKPGEKLPWLPIQGEHYAITQNPGFIWKGSTLLFTAQDSYLNQKGRLLVSVLSLFRIVNAYGKTYDQGELLRWLGESILYPTNLLPSEKINWYPIDSSTASLHFKYRDIDLKFIVRFNDRGEIGELETRRYMDKNSLETWIIKPSHYEIRNEILIPLHYEVLWRLKSHDLVYARFVLNKLEYNFPNIF